MHAPSLCKLVALPTFSMSYLAPYSLFALFLITNAVTKPKQITANTQVDDMSPIYNLFRFVFVSSGDRFMF